MALLIEVDAKSSEGDRFTVILAIPEGLSRAFTEASTGKGWKIQRLTGG